MSVQGQKSVGPDPKRNFSRGLWEMGSPCSLPFTRDRLEASEPISDRWWHDVAQRPFLHFAHGNAGQLRKFRQHVGRDSIPEERDWFVQKSGSHRIAARRRRRRAHQDLDPNDADDLCLRCEPIWIEVVSRPCKVVVNAVEAQTQ